MVFNHHQGHRGEHLVPLGNAGNLAAGFADPQSLEVLQRHFGEEDLQTLQAQLYPNASHALAVDRITTISKAEALEQDTQAASFLAQSKPVRIATSDGATVGYQVPIPAQSDFRPLALTNTMTYPTELKTMQLRQSMRPAALRRNLGTAVIVAVAFSGGPFGLTWLATSSATTFVVLMLWRLKQQQMIP